MEIPGRPVIHYIDCLLYHSTQIWANLGASPSFHPLPPLRTVVAFMLKAFRLSRKVLITSTSFSSEGLKMEDADTQQRGVKAI